MFFSLRIVRGMLKGGAPFPYFVILIWLIMHNGIAFGIIAQMAKFYFSKAHK